MTTGPYKSKTLNLISEKHRQILDQSDRGIRNLKVAASNTLQLLLYPIYILLQASRLAVKQLQQKIFDKIPQLQSKVNKNSINNQTVNKPIQPILETASETDVAQIREKQKDNKEQLLSANIQQPKMSSIATSQIAPPSQIFPPLKWEKKSNTTPKLIVESKKKVLVGRDNQKMDNLTSTQQKQLQQNLIPETINIHQNAQLQLKPCAELAPIVGPIGKFWEVMAWIQISPIALWFNLFGEVSLLATTNQPKQQPFIDETSNLLPSSNLTFRNFIHNSAKQYLYPLTTGLGLNGLLPPFDLEKYSLDSILEEEMAKEWAQMRVTVEHETQSIASVVSPSQPQTFQKVATLANTASFPQTSLVTRENATTSPQSQNTESKPKHQPERLEVKSVPIGYIKHPLEEILAWVDIIINWSEAVVAKLWQWGQKQL